MEQEYQVKIEGEKAIIIVEGDFDNEQAGEALRVAVNKSIDKGYKTIVLDMKNVQIINEYGIGKMLTFQRRLEGEGGVLMVKPLTGFVREVVDLLMLTELFPVDELPKNLEDEEEDEA